VGHRRVVVALVGLAAYRLVGVVDDLRQARELVDDASVALADSRIAEARSSLGQAEQILIAANATIHTSPELDLVGVVPIINQNLQAVRRTVGTALQLVSGGDRLLDVASPLQGADGRLEVPLRAGAIPVDAVTEH